MVILSRPWTFDVRRDGKIQGDLPGRRKARRAFSVVAFASSSAGRPRRRASSPAGGATNPGFFRLSPWWTSAREGQTPSPTSPSPRGRAAPGPDPAAGPAGGAPPHPPKFHEVALGRARGIMGMEAGGGEKKKTAPLRQRDRSLPPRHSGALAPLADGNDVHQTRRLGARDHLGA